MSSHREPTSFETRVYDTVRLIPKGKVSTYAGVGRIIGCRSPRAIGQALKRNPYMPDVPCHRVVSTSLAIGGFNGESEGPDLVRKRRLLEKEGVRFDANGIILPDHLYAP